MFLHEEFERRAIRALYVNGGGWGSDHQANSAGTGGGNSGSGRSGSTGGGNASPSGYGKLAVNPGNGNLGLSGPDYSGPRGEGTGVNDANPDNAPGKNTAKGGGGWDDHFGPAPTSPMSPEGYYDGSKVLTKNGPVDADAFARDWTDFLGQAYGDQPKDDLLDKIGNQLAGMLGFDEKNPLTDPDYNKPGGQVGKGANWGLDPIRAALAVLGNVNPVLGAANALYGGYRFFGGAPAAGSINLGPSVFGGDTSAPPGGFAAAASGVTTGASTTGAPNANSGKTENAGFGASVGFDSPGAGQPKPSPVPTPASSPNATGEPAANTSPVAMPYGVSLLQYLMPLLNRSTGGQVQQPGQSSGFSGVSSSPVFNV